MLQAISLLQSSQQKLQLAPQSKQQLQRRRNQALQLSLSQTGRRKTRRCVASGCNTLPPEQSQRLCGSLSACRPLHAARSALCAFVERMTALRSPCSSFPVASKLLPICQPFAACTAASSLQVSCSSAAEAEAAGWLPGQAGVIRPCHPCTSALMRCRAACGTLLTARNHC